MLAHYGHIDAIPETSLTGTRRSYKSVRSAPSLAARLAAERETAMLFRVLATLRIDRSLLGDVDELCWRGPAPGFADMCRLPSTTRPRRPCRGHSARAGWPNAGAEDRASSSGTATSSWA